MIKKEGMVYEYLEDKIVTDDDTGLDITYKVSVWKKSKDEIIEMKNKAVKDVENLLKINQDRLDKANDKVDVLSGIIGEIEALPE